MTQFFPTEPQHIDNFQRYHSLVASWKFSLEKLQQLSHHLHNNLSENVLTVAIAGSHGRLEGSPSSDADYILIVKDASEAAINQDRDYLANTLEQLGIPAPNKSGVFAQPRTMVDLTEGMGDADESMDKLGKRMLMLLEARPVYSIDNFQKCLAEIFERYAGDVRKEPTKELVFLLNDLIRYFRFICVNYQSSFWRENEKWPMRNLKLRHSRVIMYAGLLVLLGEASKHSFSSNMNKVKWVEERLPLTPLDRLAYVYQQNNDQGFFKIAGLYNNFLSRMSDSEIRTQLSNIGHNDRYEHPIFSELKANSDALISELYRFMLARQGQWSDRFFEYLWF